MQGSSGKSLIGRSVCYLCAIAILAVAARLIGGPHAWLLGAGALATAMVVSMGLFLFHPRLFANLFFALFCLVLLVWSALASGGPLPEAIPARLTEGLYALCAPAAAILLLEYLRRIFPGAVSRVTRRILWLLMALGAGAGLFDPSAVPALQAGICLSLAALLAVFLTAKILPRVGGLTSEQLVCATGFFFLLPGTLLEALGQAELLPGGGYVWIAALVFCCAQMLALFQQFVRVEGELRDATEKELLLMSRNADLQQLDQLRLRLLASASHELKTPLAVMSGYAQLSLHYLEESGGDERMQNYMRLISSEADRLAMVVSQLLDVARMEEDRMVWEMRPNRMDALIRDTVDTYFPVNNENHNALILELEPDLPPLVMDRERIAQVLVNLISNALRFTRHGDITISACALDDSVLVSVRDTGCGIEPDRLDDIFDRWDSNLLGQSKSPGQTGTGLSLFICKRIVEAHHGVIGIRSRPGQGTVVTFQLPVKR